MADNDSMTAERKVFAASAGRLPYNPASSMDPHPTLTSRPDEVHKSAGVFVSHGIARIHFEDN